MGHMPPLRFQYFEGCWYWTKDCCNYRTGIIPAERRSNQKFHTAKFVIRILNKMPIANCVLKCSRQRESRGVGNVSNCPNLSQTAAIDVLFSINFAIVFDFTYFRFRPSKAKWIGNVLSNRRNAAIRSVFFFLLCIAHCLLTHRVTLRS